MSRRTLATANIVAPLRLPHSAVNLTSVFLLKGSVNGGISCSKKARSLPGSAGNAGNLVDRKAGFGPQCRHVLLRPSDERRKRSSPNSLEKKDSLIEECDGFWGVVDSFFIQQVR